MPSINDKRLFSAQCEKLIPVKTLHSNPWFLVKNRGGYFTTEYRESQVIVLPVLNNMSIIMVRCKRPVLNDFPLELPAGDTKKNENPVFAAQRELTEETGIEIHNEKRFVPLHPISNSPNRNPKLIHVFSVDITNEEYFNRKQHDHEIASVECFTFEEITKMLISGDIYIGVPMALISRYLLTKLK